MRLNKSVFSILWMPNNVTWPDEVVGWRRHTKAVSDERRAEVVHLVVENYPRWSWHNFGAETAGKLQPVKHRASSTHLCEMFNWEVVLLVDSAGRGHGASVLSYHREVRGPVVFRQIKLGLVVVHGMRGFISNLFTKGIGERLWRHILDELWGRKIMNIHMTQLQ